MFGSNFSLFIVISNLGLMDSSNLHGGVDANGMDDMKEPLLEALVISTTEKRIRTVKFKIGDIHCASCATTIESVVGKLNGVESVMVSPLQGQAAVQYIPELINVSLLQTCSKMLTFYMSLQNQLLFYFYSIKFVRHDNLRKCLCTFLICLKILL